MALTKGQKKLAGVIALGGVALLVDRFVLSGPAPADAAQAESLLVEKGDPVAKAAASATRPSGRGWGAQEVGSRVSGSYERNGRPVAKGDPFHLPVVVVPSAVAHSPAGNVERPGIAFARTHQLKAIMASGGGGSALLNDRLVRVGDIIADWRVVEISTSCVLFEKGSERVKLVLSDPATKLQMIK